MSNPTRREHAEHHMKKPRPGATDRGRDELHLKGYPMFRSETEDRTLPPVDHTIHIGHDDATVYLVRTYTDGFITVSTVPVGGTGWSPEVELKSHVEVTP